MGSYKDIIEKQKKNWNSVELMYDGAVKSNPKLPFSSPLLNYSTYGGIPRNMITEFFGEPSGGKSTTAVDICKNAISIFQEEYETQLRKLQELADTGGATAKNALMELEDRGPKKILYIDLEHSFDAKWANTMGIVPGTMDIMQPPDVYAEELLQMVIDIVESGEVGMIVLDSIPSLVTRQEIDKKLGERTVASLAGLLTTFCRKVIPMLTRYETTLLIINQVRDNLDNPYVTNTPGGKALKFYCALRIMFRIGTPVDFLGNDIPNNSENPAGYIITAKIVKQKSAPWDRRNGSYYLMCNSGIRTDIDFAQLAIKNYRLILKSGAWYSLIDPTTGEILSDENGKPVKLNGMAKVLEYLQTNPEYFKRISEYIINDIEGKTNDEINQTI